MSPALRRDLVGLSATLLLCAAGLASRDADSVWFLAATVLIAIWVVVEDALTFLVADGAVISLALVALVTRWLRAEDFAVPLTEFFGMIAIDLVFSGGMLWLLREYWYRRSGVDGLGLGDVKLAASGGLLLGASGFAVALFLSSLAGIGFALGFTRRRRALSDGRIPFGCFLAPAFVLVYVAESWPGVAVLIGGRP